MGDLNEMESYQPKGLCKPWSAGLFLTSAFQSMGNSSFWIQVKLPTGVSLSVLGLLLYDASEGVCKTPTWWLLLLSDTPQLVGVAFQHLTCTVFLF